MEKSAVMAVWLETPRGKQYPAWKIRVPGMTLILTTAELNRAQQRGREYERDMAGRVGKQSVAREAAGFDGMYGQAIDP